MSIKFWKELCWKKSDFLVHRMPWLQNWLWLTTALAWHALCLLCPQRGSDTQTVLSQWLTFSELYSTLGCAACCAVSNKAQGGKLKHSLLSNPGVRLCTAIPLSHLFWNHWTDAVSPLKSRWENLAIANATPLILKMHLNSLPAYCM